MTERMNEFAIFSLGDQAVTISFGNSIDDEKHEQVVSLKNWIAQNKFHGLLDVVVAYNSLTVIYDLFVVKSHVKATAFEFVKSFIEKGVDESSSGIIASGKQIRIPVCYDEELAPDMVYLCDARKLTKEEVIEIHSGKKYKVYMVGFLPGFAYMAEVDSRITVPRKQKPREKVDAGSVGIAGTQTGIYPVSSPGGWQIIGRTPKKIFDRERDVPVLLEAGDVVEFFPISKKEFAENQLTSS
jgi:inhibitor of KinA